MKRGEIWWADLGPFRPREQTGRQLSELDQATDEALGRLDPV